MVRRIAGTIVEVGRGNITNDAIERLLNNKAGEVFNPAKFTAPPSGLFLEKVYY